MTDTSSYTKTTVLLKVFNSKHEKNSFLAIAHSAYCLNNLVSKVFFQLRYNKIYAKWSSALKEELFGQAHFQLPPMSE